MLGQLWDVVFQLIHRLRVRNDVGQMSKQMSQNFGAQDLVNPNLEPGFSLQVNIAEWVLNFAREEGQLRIIQCCPASAEQKTIYLRRAHGVRNQRADLIGDQLDGIFVIDAPINPFFLIDLRQQMQDGSFNIGWRRNKLDSLRVGTAQLLVRNMKNEWVTRP